MPASKLKSLKNARQTQPDHARRKRGKADKVDKIILDERAQEQPTSRRTAQRAGTPTARRR